MCYLAIPFKEHNVKVCVMLILHFIIILKSSKIGLIIIYYFVPNTGPN